MMEEAEVRPDRCETCRFWTNRDKETELGQCRRYPPAVEPDGTHTGNGNWPWTFPWDWCGEWQPAISDRAEGPRPTVRERMLLAKCGIIEEGRLLRFIELLRQGYSEDDVLCMAAAERPRGRMLKLITLAKTLLAEGY